MHVQPALRGLCRQRGSNEAAESRKGTVGDMVVDLAGDMGEAALDLEQLRARQGAARDEAKKTKKGRNSIEKRETHSKKRGA